METFKVPAVIADEDISRLGALKGKVNSNAIMLNGQDWTSQTVKFLGFTGKIDFADNLYHGVYRFRGTEDLSDEVDSFSFREELFKEDNVAEALVEDWQSDYDGEGQ